MAAALHRACPRKSDSPSARYGTAPSIARGDAAIARRCSRRAQRVLPACAGVCARRVAVCIRNARRSPPPPPPRRRACAETPPPRRPIRSAPPFGASPPRLPSCPQRLVEWCGVRSRRGSGISALIGRRRGAVRLFQADHRHIAMTCVLGGLLRKVFADAVTRDGVIGDEEMGVLF